MTLAQETFRNDLFAAGLLWQTGIDGLYLRSRSYARLIHGVDHLISSAGADREPIELHAPLIVPRTLLEQSDYVRSFPDLLGTVSSFAGGKSEYGALLDSLESGQDWAAHLSSTDLALCSAACHSLYPLIEKQVPSTGAFFEIFGQCYRHEPSVDPIRMQAFHMHELVCVAAPDVARAFRDEWIERCLERFRSVGLDVTSVVANDPFFGRSGALLAEGQRAEALKFELVVPLYEGESSTAITSVNLHLDHFGLPFGISTEDEQVAHSACVGFGVDRIALALLRTHGLNIDHWPAEVRDQLAL